MNFPVRCRARAIIAMGLFGLTLHNNHTMGEGSNVQAPGRLVLSAETVTGSTVRPVRTSVKWENREYDVDSGVPVLMSIVRDRKESDQRRGWALSQLAMLTTQLKGRVCLDELATLYGSAGEAEKGMILLCFMGADDRRALPLLIHTLDNAESMKLRLLAAGGLAQWNVRRGVAELVRLLESDEILPEPTRMLHVRDDALDLFRTKNRLKGWGFPAEEIRKSTESRSGLDREEIVALYTAAIKKWFAENEHRFPDWKLGDPLPEVATPEKRIPAEKRPEDK